MSFISSNQYQAETWSVTELTQYIRDLFEIDFRLQDVEVSGEISNFTRARSGHLYFTLKDENAQLKSVMWRSAAERLTFSPEEGDAVVANGRISVYEAGGAYQLYVDQLAPSGRGDLAQAFAELQQKLSDAGLFAPEHKKPIPPFPEKIGIVTSADAAALRDILQVLERRYPLVSVLIAPTLVQGKEAPAQIIRALRWLDGRTDVDSIIIARGGGSVEDLWAFNDENLAQAIFAAVHPVISGVGHEIDFTISDFVADLRAPTPSAAAELAVPNIADLQPYVAGLSVGSVTAVTDQLDLGRHAVQTWARALNHLSPRRRVESSQQRLDYLISGLDRAIAQQIQQGRAQVAVLQASLSAVNPLATLARGYAIVRGSDGQVVQSAQAVEAGDSLQIQVADGEFAATVDEKSTPKVPADG